jgi:hypothetical protein
LHRETAFVRRCHTACVQKSTTSTIVGIRRLTQILRDFLPLTWARFFKVCVAFTIENARKARLAEVLEGKFLIRAHHS